MQLSSADKYSLLMKAGDIALNAAASGNFSSDTTVDILEKTYNKMLALAEKA